MYQSSEGSANKEPWRDLSTIAEVELWITQYDQGLQQSVGKHGSSGHGVCFELAAGGNVYLHTTSDGDVVLDLEPEAAWIAPVITAATGVIPGKTQLWVLPGDVLVQLIFGLNPLIAYSRAVLEHRFRTRQTL